MNIENEKLEEFESELIKRGYRKYNGHYKHEDYGYWKSFDITKDEYGENEIGYQIAILFYNWNKYNNIDILKNTTGLQFESLIYNIPNYDRLDITSGEDSLTVEKWEKDIDKMIHIMSVIKRKAIKNKL